MCRSFPVKLSLKRSIALKRFNTRKSVEYHIYHLLCSPFSFHFHLSFIWQMFDLTHDEVMFKASTDDGKTSGNKTNLSNTPNVDSINVETAAAGSNVFVIW